MTTPVRFLVAMVLTGCLFAARAADRITLHSTIEVEGQVIRDTPGDPLVIINTGGKLLMLNRTEIASVTLDDDARTEYQRRADEIKVDKAAPHFELYKWAKSHRMYDYADRELSATLKAEPGHVEARKIAFAPATQSKPSPEAAAPAPADDQPVIGLRPVVQTVHLRSDFEDKIFNYCRALLPLDPPDENARKAAVAALNSHRDKAAEAVVAYLDPARGADESTRRAALAGIGALKPASPDVSKRLASMAMFDSSPIVRKETVELIKARNDEVAMNSMVKTLLASYDDQANVRDPQVNAAAVAALQLLEDKRVYGALYYYATLEIRVTNTSLVNFVTRQIDSYTVQSNGVGANGLGLAVIIPLSFPIQFPELGITTVKTTCSVPCTALTALSGADFGNDLDKWAKWMRLQK